MTIFTIKNIYKAYNDCLKHKKNTTNALKFELNREKNLHSLLKDLQNRTYKISRHICFVVTVPTAREIFAADFRDRIIHHVLYNEIRDLFESNFIEESYANRLGKGTHMAVRKLRYHIARGGKDGRRLYYLKMDIKGFFRNIDKNILYEEVSKNIKRSNREKWWKEEILWITKIIIFHNPTSNYVFKGANNTRGIVPKHKSLFYGDRNKGLPIGNLTSQFFANIYLDKLDHYIKEKLKFYRYLRYVDDFIILNEDKERLEEAIEKINLFLEQKLNLKLAPDKIYLRQVNHGIDFLGYYIKPTHTLVRRKVVRRFKDKIYKNRNKDDGFYSIKFLPVIRSYLGHFEHAHSYNLRRKTISDNYWF